MRIAFYAPLKAPGHPTPSGDRALARLLFAALARAGGARGWEVELASRFRSFEGAGDAERQARLRDAGARLAGRLVRRYRRRPAGERPGLWFTYHLYHKAPDWLGPPVSDRLGIPYVVAEASHAPKQAGGAWSMGHEAAARAIRRADAILALNRDDVPGLLEAAGDPSRITAFAPFLGPDGVAPDGGFPAAGPPRPPARGEEPAASGRPGSSGARADAAQRAAAARRFGMPADVPWLLCAAMMRGGRKLASFDVLAEALARLTAERWHLAVAGDGPARRGVEAALARRLPAGRTTFTGRIEGGALAGLYAASDLFVWPAVGEPLGMAMLEAQGYGLPVVAARTRGVPDLVDHAATGLLVPEGDPAAFAEAIAALLRAPARRRRMGVAARARIAREHRFEAAAERLGALVEGLVRHRADGREPERRIARTAEAEPAGAAAA